MFKNYLKITFRTLAKYRGFSLINVIGLALSMAVCLIIILFIREETSFDDFHQNKDRIYRVNSNVKYRNGVDALAASPAPMAAALRNDYAGVENAVSLTRFESVAIHDENNLAIGGVVAEPNFFDVFDFRLQAGNAENALLEPNTAVLNDEAAKRLFGEENPVGATVVLDGLGSVKITGVLAEPGGRSHFDRYLGIVVSYESLRALGDPRNNPNDWRGSIERFYTYILLKEGTRRAEIEAAFPQIVDKYFPEAEPGDVGFFLQALTGIRQGPSLSNKLERQTPPALLNILSALAVILVIAACFNYMNLSVARSLKRTREVGIRKVAGAFRRQIILQFIGEAVVVSWIALIIALIFLEMWFIPAFNDMWLVQVYLDTNISLDVFTNASTLLVSLAFSTTVGLLAGLYPAVIFSSYRPSAALKGATGVKGFFGMTLRKSLIVIQFALSIIFIISTLTIYQQSEHMLAADYGFDKEHVLNVALQDQSYDVLRHEWMSNPKIENVSAVSLIPGTGDRERTYLKLDGQDEPVLMTFLSTDENFIANLDVPLVAGRNFSRASADAPGSSLILNKKAVEQLQLGSPQEALGRILTNKENKSLTVVGVIENFYNMQLGVTGALVLINDPARFNYANIRIAPDNMLGTVTFIEETWQKVVPNRPIQHRFFDQQITAQFAEFRDYIKVIATGAGFIVLIACLGLLGMATYNAETRLKEVGVRKVLGASVSNLLFLLSRDFLKLIVIAAFVAIPSAWYLSDMLLQNFNYRIDLGASVFILGVGATLVLAFITVASQSVKAAVSNPVETLRYE